MQRRATTAVALTLALLSAAPAAILGQTRSSGRDPNAQGLLVAVFASPDRLLGVQVADAIRSRIQSAANARQVWVIPKADIINFLESSGYKADSSLGPSDLKELAKLLRADEILFGTVTRTPTGIKVEPRLLRATDVSQGQPLPTVDAANAGDASRPVERALTDARKQLPDQRACENHIRDKAFDKAILAANAGITKYPSSTLARLCLALAYREKNQPDSVIRVVDEIRRIDPKNSFAWRQAYWAYDTKGDAENVMKALVQLYALEPSNLTLQDQVVAALARLGKPSIALPIVAELLLQNPGDPKLLRQKWLLSLQLAAAADSASRPALVAKAVAAGEEMVKSDTTLADSTYFARQIFAANAMTPPRGLEFASRAVQKFPNNAEFWALKANAERKAGQLQMAIESIKRALSLNAKQTNGNLILAQSYVEMNQTDSALAVAHRAVASGEDAKTWGAFILQPTQTAFKVAQETKAIPDYERALMLATESDNLAQSAHAKFFKGVASFQIAMQAIQDAQKPKSCPLAKKAQEMFLQTQLNMPAGGMVNPETARTILGHTATYAPTADAMVKQYCK